MSDAAAPPGEAPEGRPAASPTVGQLISDVSTHLSSIVQGEINLAKAELKSSVTNAGAGVGLFVAAVVLVFFSLTFLFIAGAEGITALGLPRWSAYLIMFAVILLLAGLCVLIGYLRVKRVKAPTRTIETSKDTVAFLKATAKRG